jgi:RHS repeat-associated protein
VYLPDGRQISYDYDPLGRRITKRIDGVIVEKYLWEGLTRLLAVYDGTDQRLIRFRYADARMPVAMTYLGDTYYLLYDQVGSLRMVVGENGSVVKQIEYDSFGYIINDSAPSFSIPFGFAGGLYDVDTGLIRFGHRDYDPEIGRWTAKDPILFSGVDTDLFGYVQYDPINFVDPWGLINWGTVGIGALSTLGGGITVVTGALASTTGAGAIGGVAAVLLGSAGVSWGISQMIVGILDDNIPFITDFRIRLTAMAT